MSERRFLAMLCSVAVVLAANLARADVVQGAAIKALDGLEQKQAQMDQLKKDLAEAEKKAGEALDTALTPGAASAPAAPALPANAAARKSVRALVTARDVAGLKAIVASVKALAASDDSTDELCGTAALAACQATVDAAYKAFTDVLDSNKKKLDAKQAELDAARATADSALQLQERVSAPRYGKRLSDRLAGARRVRCLTAYCWGGADGTSNAIEPILDLPIGISWAVGNGGLANYVNSNRVDVTVSAGLRYWFDDDIMSVGVLIARPSLSNSASIRIEQSDVTFTNAAVSRPFPTLMLGFWGDIFSVTVSYDQLRNTNGSGPADPKFLTNEVLSRTLVFGLAINPFTAARNAIGAANSSQSNASE